MTRTHVSSFALAVVLFAASSARAQEGGQEAGATAVAPEGSQPAAAPEGDHAAEAGEAEAPEHAPSHLVLGVVGTGLVTTAFAESPEVNGAIGGGVFAEYTVVPNWLAVELDVRLMGSHEGDAFATELPIDLLLKKPFELSETLEAYIGIGGTLVPVLSSVEAGANSVHGGLASVVGGYYWFGDHAALTAELDYNLLLDAPNVVQEVGVSAGVALGI